MSDIYEYASKLLKNIPQTSDSVGFSECYNLCANKNYLPTLTIKSPQIIYGRRGTGKTTLLKAFTHNINCVNYDPNSMAIYILMTDMFPKTDEEIRRITENSCSVALYTLARMVLIISKELEKMFNIRTSAMSGLSDSLFAKAYISIQDSANAYTQQALGAKIALNRSTREEINRESGITTNGSLGIIKSPLTASVSMSRNRGKLETQKTSLSIDGNIYHTFEVTEVRDWLLQMLSALGISILYLSIDEFCELDILNEPNLQIQVAELIKEVFLKCPNFSVKIASIWNRANMCSREGTKRIKGIEIGHDIFQGPDLDLMFIREEIDTQGYFKRFLLNTLYIDDTEQMAEVLEKKDYLADYLVKEIFGEDGFRQLIVASQGISRAFATLVKEYLEIFTRQRKGVLKLEVVYDIIKTHYLSEVRNKTPIYKLCRIMDEFVVKNQSRYFLIAHADYYRCKNLIKWLEFRDYFRQMPSTLTARAIRDKYKLFVIHYGNYLDALETASYKQGRKNLTDAAKTQKLVPKYDEELTINPEKYLLSIPERVEYEVACSNCHTIFERENLSEEATCPRCGETVMGFDEFVDLNN